MAQLFYWLADFLKGHMWAQVLVSALVSVLTSVLVTLGMAALLTP